MGIVYKALDLKLNRDVALKVLPPELVSDPDRKHRFIQEAQAAAALKHPNIAVIYEIGEDDGVDFIAMELIEGEKLSELMARGRLRPQRALDIATEVAKGLAKAHSKGIVHRDLKPANLMMTDDGHTKIIDFGLAKLVEPLLDEDSEAQTRGRGETAAGEVMGTLSYMSPEQARGERVDHRSDIFTLGVVLYEMLTGKLPFTAPSDAEVPYAIINDPTPPLPPGTPSPIVDKCLRKKPADRYQTASELAAALREVTMDSDAAPAPRRWSAPAAIVAAVVVVAGLVFLRPFSEAPSDAIDSLAVLPFENARNDPEVDYLSDGIPETLINRLSELSQLRVMARSSSFRYRDPLEDPRSVGQELDVGAVLTGRVVQQGSRLNVQAELLSVEDGRQLWGEQYQRELEELVTVQNNIAEEIVDALRLRLGSEEHRGLAEYGTQNSEAYRAYLKGRYFWGKRTHADLVKAIDLFEEAKQADPDYALAYAGLADSHLLVGAYNPGPDTLRSEEMEKAKAAAEKALALDPDLAEAYVSRGYIEFLYDWDWEAAERDFLKAIELDRSYAVAHQWYGEFLSVMGRHDEAIEQTRIAVELEPTSPIISRELGFKFSMAGRFEEAIAQFQKTLDLDPDFPATHDMLTGAYWYAGRVDEAVAQAQNLDDARREFFEALARGDNEAAVARIDAALEEGHLPLTTSASYYTMAGAEDKAFDLLEQAVRERSPQVLVAQNQAAFQPYRADPRFVAIRRTIGLER